MRNSNVCKVQSIRERERKKVGLLPRISQKVDSFRITQRQNE